jgi:hypothetical protein
MKNNMAEVNMTITLEHDGSQITRTFKEIDDFRIQENQWSRIIEEMRDTVIEDVQF